MDPLRIPEESDQLLYDLYEIYYPPRDEEMYQDFMDWSEWTDPM
ncbi:hypothetical protein [Brevibacillus sp. SYP-B805]|nr:hypothetical protein [Brevibacillus sp. SYP-B805]